MPTIGCIESIAAAHRSISQEVSELYVGRGVQFIGINHQDDREPALAFQRQFRIRYPSAFDPAGGLAPRYRVIGIPTTVIIRRDGRIAYRFLGKVDVAMLRAALDEVLRANPVSSAG